MAEIFTRLIALMLGRLRMTIPQAKKHFKALSGNIFKGRKPGGLLKGIKAGLGEPFFDGEDMTKAIKDLLKNELNENPEMDLRERPDPECKV